jgi:hypothetical protein
MTKTIKVLEFLAAIFLVTAAFLDYSVSQCQYSTGQEWTTDSSQHIAVLAGLRYIEAPVTPMPQGFCCTAFDQEPL